MNISLTRNRPLTAGLKESNIIWNHFYPTFLGMFKQWHSYKGTATQNSMFFRSLSSCMMQSPSLLQSHLWLWEQSLWAGSLSHEWFLRQEGGTTLHRSSWKTYCPLHKNTTEHKYEGNMCVIIACVKEQIKSILRFVRYSRNHLGGKRPK